MREGGINEHLRSSFEQISSLTNANTVIGSPITTPNGVTVIPVSKVTMGYASGGVDFGNERGSVSKSAGGGGGTGVAITPIAFLSIGADAEVKLIPVSANVSVDKVASLIEHAPELIEKIRDALT